MKIRLTNTEKAFGEGLVYLVDLIYDRAARNDLSWAQLAEKAELSVNTVYRLGNRITQRPGFFTMFKLCRAVGVELSITSRKRSAA